MNVCLRKPPAAGGAGGAEVALMLPEPLLLSPLALGALLIGSDAPDGFGEDEPMAGDGEDIEEEAGTLSVVAKARAVALSAGTEAPDGTTFCVPGGAITRI